MCNGVYILRLCELRVVRSTLGNYIVKCIENSKPIVRVTAILPNTFRLKITFTSHLCVFLRLIYSTYSRQYTGLFLHPITLGETQTHSIGLLLKTDRSSHRPLLDTTQHSHEIDIHAPGDTRTRYPSKRTVADLRFDSTAAAIDFIIQHHYKITALPLILII